MEFHDADSARTALTCSGALLGEHDLQIVEAAALMFVHDSLPQQTVAVRHAMHDA